MTEHVNRFPSIEQMTQSLQKQGNKNIKPVNQNGMSFAEVLQQKTSGNFELKFSKHAASRMETRNIDLSTAQKERLELGVRQAQQKGINESLVMVDDLAFIVNINSSTVITAVAGNDEKVFTNIDGAVIA